MGSKYRDMESTIHAEVKVVMLGNQRTGKTCIMEKLTRHVFSESYATTIGVEYDSRILEVDGKLIKIHLWDVSGQESFLWLAKKPISEADGFLLVYDVTDRDSFHAIRRWWGHTRNASKTPNLPTLLMGNKLDLRHKQVVACSEAKEFAIPEGMRHIEISANTGQNLTAGFYILATDILRHRKLGCRLSLGVTDPLIESVTIHEDPACETKTVVDGPEYTHLFKILLLGSVRSGKTSLRYRFCRDHFSPEYFSTAGFDYSTRTVMIDGERVKLQIWDVSGHSVYEQARRSYYKGANGYVIVYDVTDKESFAHADRLLKELNMFEQSEAPKVVVGNKSDVPSNKRKVHYDTVHDWSDGWRLPSIETSARHGTNVDSVFLKIAIALKRQMAPWKRLYNFSQ